MANISIPSLTNMEDKSWFLERIAEHLMQNCNQILAIFLTDWEATLSASKFSQDLNKDEISTITLLATTPTTFKPDSLTRQELKKSLLGNKFSYLIMALEIHEKLMNMYIFPIDTFGYVACITRTTENMAYIIENLGIAANKVAEVLIPSQEQTNPATNPATSPVNPAVIDAAKTIIQGPIDPRYDSLVKKLEEFKKAAFNSS